MKAQVKLALQQAAMRARPGCDLRRREKTLGSVAEDGLERRIAALVIARARDWTAADVARHFGWRIKDVAAWFEAGKPLL